MGWGSALDQLLKKLPVQDRTERWKNKYDNLKKEREKLLKGKWDVQKAKRLDIIDCELDKLIQLCKNALK